MISREHIQRALQDPAEFKRIFDKTLDLRYVGEKYADQVQPLISYILVHTEEFDRLIDNRSSLIYLVEQLPGISDTIIRYVIRHPTEFDRLIKSEFDLKACAKSAVFKKYAGIFQKPTLETARMAVMEMNKAMMSNYNIMQAVYGLSLGMLDSDSTLNVLPAELIIKIASYMRDSSVQTVSEAEKAAHKYHGEFISKRTV